MKAIMKCAVIGFGMPQMPTAQNPQSNLGKTVNRVAKPMNQLAKITNPIGSAVGGAAGGLGKRLGGMVGGLFGGAKK